MKNISRSGGNTVRALAYRAGVTLTDPFTATRFDYTDKEVIRVDFHVPENAPSWAQNLKDKISGERRQGITHLSEIAESFEKRKDAIVYKELEIALPKELNEQQNIQLVTELCEDQFAKRGIAALACYHFDEKDNGEKRPHVHIMLLTRFLEEKGLSQKKNSDLYQKEFLQEIRQQIANYINYHLRLNGVDEYVTHESYAARGIDLIPQKKLGRFATQQMRDPGLESNFPSAASSSSEHLSKHEISQDSAELFECDVDPWKYHGFHDEEHVISEKLLSFMDIRDRNLFKILRRPELLLEVLHLHKTSFKIDDIKTIIRRFTDDPNLIESLLNSTLQSPSIVYLGMKEGKDFYSTKEVVEREGCLISIAKELSEEKIHRLPEDVVEQHIQVAHKTFEARGGLKPDQMGAIRFACAARQAGVITGYAGAGKTTVLKVIKDAYEHAGYHVLGLTPTHRASFVMTQDAGINSQTIHAFNKAYLEGRNQLKAQTLLIVDEAGMIDSEQFSITLAAAKKLGWKVLFVGDSQQLSPVGAGRPFKAIEEALERFTLQSIVRQRMDWQKQATVYFGRGEASKALALYRDHHHIKIIQERTSSFENIDKENVREVLRHYNTSRRLSLQYFHFIERSARTALGLLPTEHLARSVIEEHELYPIHKWWAEQLQQSVSHIKAHLSQYAPMFHEMGTDPRAFAALAVSDSGIPNTTDQKIHEFLVRHNFINKPPSGRASAEMETRAETRDAMINAWLHNVLKAPDEAPLMLAYTNRDVDILNASARSALKEEGFLKGPEFVVRVTRSQDKDIGVYTSSKRLKLAVGDRLLLRGKDSRHGIKANTFAIIEEIDSKNIKVLTSEGQNISFSPNLYKNFTYGYASTVHKAQGVTAQSVYILASPEMTPELTYVALSRHTDQVHIFGSSLDFASHEKLISDLSTKDIAYEISDFDAKIFKYRSISALQQFRQEAANHQRAATYAWEFATRRFVKWFMGTGMVEVERGTTSPEAASRSSQALVRASSSEQIPEKGGVPENRVHNPNQTPQSKHVAFNIRRQDILNRLTASAIENIYREHLPFWDGDNVIRKKAGELRVGRSGSLSIDLRRGVWQCFKSGKGGDIFQFVAESLKISYREALYNVAERVDLSEHALSAQQKLNHELLQETARIKALEERESKIKNAENFYQHSFPGKGTLVERYLREHRGYQGSVPQDIRYYKSKLGESMVAFVRNSEGRITGYQQTFLDPVTASKSSHMDLVKKSGGVLRGSFARLQEGKGITFVAEGIETALAIKEAMPRAEILCSLGRTNVKNLQTQNTTLVIVADWDGEGAKTHEAVEKDADMLRERGHEVHVLWPIKHGLHKCDFNDVLVKHGVKAVRDSIHHTLPKQALRREQQPTR